jgi:hypothetical protein
MGLVSIRTSAHSRALVIPAAWFSRSANCCNSSACNLEATTSIHASPAGIHPSPILSSQTSIQPDLRLTPPIPPPSPSHPSTDSVAAVAVAAAAAAAADDDEKHDDDVDDDNDDDGDDDDDGRTRSRGVKELRYRSDEE